MENYVEILGNIMQKKVMIMPKRRQIVQKSCYLGFFQRIKYTYTLTFYQEFQSLISCLTFAAVHGQVFLPST